MQTQNNYSGIKNELKQIGDRIEAIADQLKSSGQASKFEDLHRLGDEVEHFFDDLEDDVGNTEEANMSGNGNPDGRNVSTAAGARKADVTNTRGNSALSSERKQSRPIQNNDEDTSYGNMKSDSSLKNFNNSGLDSVKNKF